MGNCFLGNKQQRNNAQQVIFQISENLKFILFGGCVTIMSSSSQVQKINYFQGNFTII